MNKLQFFNPIFFTGLVKCFTAGMLREFSKPMNRRCWNPLESHSEPVIILVQHEPETRSIKFGHKLRGGVELDPGKP